MTWAQGSSRPVWLHQRHVEAGPRLGLGGTHDHHAAMQQARQQQHLHVVRAAEVEVRGGAAAAVAAAAGGALDGYVAQGEGAHLAVYIHDLQGRRGWGGVGQVRGDGQVPAGEHHHLPVHAKDTYACTHSYTRLPYM